MSKKQDMVMLKVRKGGYIGHNHNETTLKVCKVAVECGNHNETVLKVPKSIGNFLALALVLGMNVWMPSYQPKLTVPDAPEKVFVVPDGPEVVPDAPEVVPDGPEASDPEW